MAQTAPRASDGRAIGFLEAGKKRLAGDPGAPQSARQHAALTIRDFLPWGARIAFPCEVRKLIVKVIDCGNEDFGGMIATIISQMAHLIPALFICFSPMPSP